MNRNYRKFSSVILVCAFILTTFQLCALQLKNFTQIMAHKKKGVVKNKVFSDRQKIIVDKMKELINNKTTSAEYGDEFVRFLERESSPQNSNVIMRCTIDSNLSYSSYVVGKYMHSNMNQEKCIQFEHFVKKVAISVNKQMDVFISLNDTFGFSPETTDFIKNHIILLSCENRKEKGYVAIPIPDFYTTDPSNHKLFSENIKNEIPFFDRENKAKFIGQQTSIYSRYRNTPEWIEKTPRLKAFHLARKYPDHLLVDFLSYQTCADEEYVNYMYNTFGPPAPYEPMETLAQYRYLLSFDGCTSPWLRPEFIMRSGSVPLFQTRFEKFWTILLEDGVNYIKINDDVSNLVDSVIFLKNHPEYAEKVARNAQSLGQDVLTSDFFRRYLEELFNETNHQQNKKK